MEENKISRTDRKRESMKKWREKNPNYDKEYHQKHREERKEYNKKYNFIKYEEGIDHIIWFLKSIQDGIDFLPKYGSVYKITNTKTGKSYIGQSTKLLKERYHGNIIKSWIEERKAKPSQKFIEELIEEDFEVTEVLDDAFCQRQLDMLEAFYIYYYDTFNFGYNINAGLWNSIRGVKEFNEILEKNNLIWNGIKLTKMEV